MVRPTAVIGLGRSGISAARLLHAQGHMVCLLEQRQTPRLHRTATALRHEGLAGAAQLPFGGPGAVESPSGGAQSLACAGRSPVLVRLRRRGVPVHGETELAWQTMTSAPWIGITGTNGKTTITTMVGHCCCSRLTGMPPSAATVAQQPPNWPWNATGGAPLTGWWRS